MALAADQVQLVRQGRSLLMGPGTVYTVVPGWDPWSRTTRAPQSQERPYGHGSVRGAEWVDEATVFIPVSVNRLGATKAEWLAAHQEMAAAFTAVGGSGELCELYFEHGGSEFVMFGSPKMPRVNGENLSVGKSVNQVAFVASDPRVYSAEVSSLSTGLPVQQGGLMVPARIATTRLRLPDVSGSYASTPNHASLQVTGDLSLRVDADLDSWLDGSIQQLITKYGSAGAISYALNVDSTGFARFQWSADGTNVLTATCTVPFVAEAGRVRLRADIDVDNGAAGRSIRFYTAPSMSGPWTQLGSTVTQAGVTSIFSGSAPLEVGSRGGGSTQTIKGSVYAAQVLNSASTVVANPDFTAQAYGATSFADSTGKTWTVHGTAKLVGGTYRNGLRLPFMVPGRLNGGSVTFANLGTAAVSFTARVDGPVVEPWILVRQPDGTTQSIRFDLTLAAGQWLTIDTASRQALLNDSPSANQRGRATWLVDPDPILPGVTTIRFGAAEYKSDAKLTVTARSAWW
jgi:hypothetical protein